ncbi:hypothetical protein AMECASPLE_034631, partial [Ameca splendens]
PEVSGRSRLPTFRWISFPRTKLAASCFPPSPEPRPQEKPSGLLPFVNLDPESLYPWRPDCTYLLAIHPFMFQSHL